MAVVAELDGFLELLGQLLASEAEEVVLAPPVRLVHVALLERLALGVQLVQPGQLVRLALMGLLEVHRTEHVEL